MNAPLPPEAEARAAVQLLAPDRILASPSNPRKHFDDAYLAELADTIRAHGVIQPITVRPLPLESRMAFNKRRKRGDDSHPEYEIVVGECRWRASVLAGQPTIPAFIRELDDKQVLEIQVIENLTRRDVHPLEEAEGYQALMTRHGYSADQLAARIGKSRSYIYGRLKFTALVLAVREEFFAGRIDASTALLIARIPGESLQKKAAAEIIKGYNGEPLSYRTAKQHIRSRYTLDLAAARFDIADAGLLPAAGACSACPRRSGNFQDLFNDIAEADVCTDPDCFEAKRLARHDQLIANAERLAIPVLTGDDGRDAWHGGDFVNLDAVCRDDAERRSYRQILGEQAPAASALIALPYGDNELVECISHGAMAKALKKAGWQPADGGAGDNAETRAQRLAAEQRRQEENSARAALEEKAEAESARRREALVACTTALHAVELDTDQRTETLFYLLAEAWFRNMLDVNELADLEDGIRDHLDPGYRLPDEFDDTVEIPRAVALLHRAALGRVVAFLLADMVKANECHLNRWNLNEDRLAQAAPATLARLCATLGVGFTSITHPEMTPAIPAKPAQAGRDTPASGKGKAGKSSPAKADPAYPAAKPEPWPFPAHGGLK